MNPGKIVRGTKMDDARCSAIRPGYRARCTLDTALDWSAWDVQTDPLTGAMTPPGTGGDPARRLRQGRRDVQQQRPLPQVRRRHDVPELSRHARRGAPDTRPRQHAAARPVRPARPGCFAGDAVHEALDLCVSCKGCRRECPTGVDMARMKIEFAWHWQKKHGLSLKDRLIATMPKWAPWAARFPFVANLRDTLPGAARLSERVAGLTAQRVLPQWRRDTFLSSRAAREAGAEAPDVVLLVDTFNNYHEPENAHAALRVLRAAGYRVAVARPKASDREPGRPLCCGRTYLTAGLVDEARREALRMVDALLPHVAEGATIVGLEPSCLLSLRDEFLVMGLGEDAGILSKRALLIEEFLAREHAGGRLDLKLKALPQKRALVHGHCHQKAFGAARSGADGPRADPRSEGRGDRVELLRHGRQLRLRGRALRDLDAHGRTFVAARRACRAAKTR